MKINRGWKPPRWVLWLYVVVSAPFWLPFIALIAADRFIRKSKRRLRGPHVGRWQKWFAWHFVTLDGGWGDTVWLESVHRQALGTSYGNGVVYARDPALYEAENPSQFASTNQAHRDGDKSVTR